MTDRSGGPGNGAAAAGGSRLVPQVLMMSRAFWASRQRNKILLLGIALVFVIVATAFGQIRLNAWSRPFYDAIQRKDLREFLAQLVVFGIIAGGLLILNVAQAWLQRMTRNLAREGLTCDLLDEWLKPGRASRLPHAGEIGANPDQRIDADVFNLANQSTDLGIGLLQSAVLLGSFIGVLWILSENVTFLVSGRSFVIPGYMVWCAFVYAGTASWLSWCVGRPLIQLNAELKEKVGEFRSALKRASEEIDAVALYRGEEDEKWILVSELKHILSVARRIVSASMRLTWITAGYGWLTIIAPILIAAPGYFGGGLSFGELMMAVGAFGQVQQSLRWFIDNFSTIADWRATLLRIANFREAVATMDRLGATEYRIELVETHHGEVTFEDLQIATPTGCTMLSERYVEIVQGEHVLIVGEPGTGKTILFRAIAGLWPWGSGRIGLPSDGVMFIPRWPYLPRTTLRAALAYPSPETIYRDEELVAVLKRVALDRLSSSLSQVARWDKELTHDEQQCLVFTRILLHKPSWVVIDEALDALDNETREWLISLFKDELRHTAFINIGRPETKDRFFTRVLHLIKDPLGTCFIPERRAD